MNTSSGLLSCSGIDAVVSLLSPLIEAQGDSIDFYLERKALDPFMDGLEHNNSSRSLR